VTGTVIKQAVTQDLSVGAMFINQIYIKQAGAVVLVNKSKIRELIKALKKQVEAA